MREAVYRERVSGEKFPVIGEKTGIIVKYQRICRTTHCRMAGSWSVSQHISLIQEQGIS